VPERLPSICLREQPWPLTEVCLWGSAGTAYYGYSGDMPVAVVRPLSAIHGRWTWTLLIGPPAVLQGFEAAGERPDLSGAKDKAKEAWLQWCTMAALTPR
jgi:hypothetical protein